MTFDRFAQLFPDDVAHLTVTELASIWYLEHHGKQFMVDFGYNDAEQMAWGRYFLGIVGSA